MKARKLTQPTGRPVHVVEPTRHARAYRPETGRVVTDPLARIGRVSGKGSAPKRQAQRGKS